MKSIWIGVALATAVVGCKKKEETPAGPMTAEQITRNTDEFENIVNRLCACPDLTCAKPVAMEMGPLVDRLTNAKGPEIHKADSPEMRRFGAMSKRATKCWNQIKAGGGPEKPGDKAAGNDKAGSDKAAGSDTHAGSDEQDSDDKPEAK